MCVSASGAAAPCINGGLLVSGTVCDEGLRVELVMCYVNEWVLFA